MARIAPSTVPMHGVQPMATNAPSASARATRPAGEPMLRVLRRQAIEHGAEDAGREQAEADDDHAGDLAHGGDLEQSLTEDANGACRPGRRRR